MDHFPRRIGILRSGSHLTDTLADSEHIHNAATMVKHSFNPSPLPAAVSVSSTEPITYITWHFCFQFLCVISVHVHVPMIGSGHPDKGCHYLLRQNNLHWNYIQTKSALIQIESACIPVGKSGWFENKWGNVFSLCRYTIVIKNI